MDDSKTKVTGIWVDPLTERRGSVPRAKSVTVRQTVRQLTKQVVSNVNNAFSLEPPLVCNEMIINHYPLNVVYENLLHDVGGEDGLVVLIRPSVPQQQRIKNRFETFQDNEDIIDGLLNFIEDEESRDDSESEAEDNRGEQLNNLFKGLREDIKDQKKALSLVNETLIWERKERKEEMAGLNEILILERKERKEEMARLNEIFILERKERREDMARLNEIHILERKERKEETARLNRILLLEQEENKVKNGRLKEEVASLKVTLTKEREERQADVARLEETIEDRATELSQCRESLEQHKLELAMAKAQHREDIETISELTLRLIPINLRVLLDYSRERVLKHLGLDNWDDFRQGKTISQLTDMIISGLANVEDGPSREAVIYLCSYTNVRRNGSYSAHNASQMEIKYAVEMTDSRDRLFLEQFYRFIYNTSI